MKGENANLFSSGSVRLFTDGGTGEGKWCEKPSVKQRALLKFPMVQIAELFPLFIKKGLTLHLCGVIFYQNRIQKTVYIVKE